MLIVYKFKKELPIGLVIQLLLERLEQVLDAVRGECRLAKGKRPNLGSGLIWLR